MNLRIAKFKFNTATHFGEIGIGIENVEEIIHSDTLFSAICHAWAYLYGKTDLDDLLDRFSKTTPFLLSSCFIYNNDSYFLPKPLTPPPGFEDMGIRESYGRTVKEMKYITRDVFELWAKRGKIDYGTIPDYKPSYERILMPRVTLDRATSCSQIFHCGAIKFHEKCGLYCLIRFDDLSYEEKVRTSLAMLGELGLGGERSYGFGKFELNWKDAGDEWGRLFAIEGDYCLLSLFHPEDLDNIENLVEGASYTLIERRGWLLSPFSRKQYKRKTVTMFAEGSVFTKPITGHLVDVTPDIWKKEVDCHPIYRYGFAFTIPAKREEPRYES